MVAAYLSRTWVLLSLTVTSLCTNGFRQSSLQLQRPAADNGIDSAIAIPQSQYTGHFDLPLKSLGGRLGEGTSGSVRLLDEPQYHAGNFQIAVKSFWDVCSIADIRHEYLIASSLQHPNLVHTFDFRESFNGTHTAYHLLMEYLPYDLPAYTRAFLRPRQHLFQIFRQVCQGVAYMHSRGLAHLDLKPENVLVNGEGTPKIIDFGSSEVVTPILLLPRSTCVVVGRNNLVHGVRGSEPYMPPEVYGEARYDSQKVDVWALGIIFVQIALGDYGMPWSFSAMEDPVFAAFVGAADEGANSEKEVISALEVDQAVEPEVLVGMSREDLLRHLPRGSRSMVGRMLEIDPGKRPTIEEVLGTRWLEAIV